MHYGHCMLRTEFLCRIPIFIILAVHFFLDFFFLLFFAFCLRRACRVVWAQPFANSLKSNVTNRVCATHGCNSWLKVEWYCDEDHHAARFTCHETGNEFLIELMCGNGNACCGYVGIHLLWPVQYVGSR